MSALVDVRLDPGIGPAPEVVAGVARVRSRVDRVRSARAGARWRYAANVLPTAAVLLAFDAAVVLDRFLAARVYALAFLFLVPGALLVALLRSRPADGAVRLALVVAASSGFLTVAALAASVVLPHLGVTQPLGRGPMTVVVNEAVLVLALLVARAREPFAALLEDRTPTLRQAGVVAALAMLPIASAGAAQAVNNGRGSAPMVFVLGVAGAVLLGMLLAAGRVRPWVLATALYAVALTLVYSYSLSGDQLFGWDVQQELRAFALTMQQGGWTAAAAHGDPYRAMLSITALPVALVNVTGVTGISVLRVGYPLLFAFFPVLVFAVVRRFVPPTAAFAAAAFVVVQLPFSQQMPAITRQEVALLFFGVLVAVAFDDGLPVRTRRVLVLLAGVALACTHYSTAYVTSLALVGTWIAAGLLHLARRRRTRHRRVLVGWVVLGILGATLVWNVGVTHSSDNVLRFAQQAAERGPEFLPSSKGRSLVARWLVGNAPQHISGDEYARRIALIYGATAPWVHHYPHDEIVAHPVRDAASPRVTGVLPQAGALEALLLTLVSQGFVVVTAAGVVAFAWRQRRGGRVSARELALLALVVLGFVGIMRVSGVAAEAYNQERAQIHAAAVLSVGFGTVAAWSLARWRRCSLAVLGAGLLVVLAASSGLAALVGGGDAPANLGNGGDAAERFAVTDAEVATTRWLAAHRNPRALVYTDRYGKLRIWAGSTIGDDDIVDALVPATLDQSAYVYASEANVRGGRARGAIGPDYAVYEFPRAFLDANKSVVYSTGATRIYR